MRESVIHGSQLSLKVKEDAIKKSFNVSRPEFVRQIVINALKNSTSVLAGIIVANSFNGISEGIYCDNLSKLEYDSKEFVGFKHMQIIGNYSYGQYRFEGFINDRIVLEKFLTFKISVEPVLERSIDSDIMVLLTPLMHGKNGEALDIEMKPLVVYFNSMDVVEYIKQDYFVCSVIEARLNIDDCHINISQCISKFVGGIIELALSVRSGLLGIDDVKKYIKFTGSSEGLSHIEFNRIIEYIRNSEGSYESTKRNRRSTNQPEVNKNTIGIHDVIDKMHEIMKSDICMTEPSLREAIESVYMASKSIIDRGGYIE